MGKVISGLCEVLEVEAGSAGCALLCISIVSVDGRMEVREQQEVRPEDQAGPASKRAF